MPGTRMACLRQFHVAKIHAGRPSKTATSHVKTAFPLQNLCTALHVLQSPLILAILKVTNPTQLNSTQPPRPFRTRDQPVPARFASNKMTQPVPFELASSSVCVAFVFLFVYRVVNWFLRIRTFRKTMPAIPTLFPPDSQYRQVWPKKWQTFHKDWHMQYQRSVYRQLDSDIFALVCLFQYDKVFVSDPSAVLELKVIKPREFPRDMHVFKRVYSNLMQLT
jgi:hypothetical protein